MSATLVGALNMGELSPICVQGLGAAGAQLQANLTGALALQSHVSIGAPPLVAQVASLEAAIANLESGIALGLPGISFSIAQAAQLVAACQVAIGTLGTLTALLGGPAAYVYSYSGGTVSTIATDLGTAITGSPPPGLTGSSATAGILVGAGVTDWVSISPFFGGVP